jgi:D-aminoacyl-tRNA deacylase
MRISLINSRQDPGGVNIRSRMEEFLEAPHRPYHLEMHDYEFLETRERLIFQDRIDEGLESDLLIFLSRHASVNPVPQLTVHVTGNITTADFGGIPGSLAVAAPAWMHAVLGNLSRYAPPGFRVSYEATHHGPSEISTPSLFVEVGSTEKEWNDPEAGAAVAMSVLTALPGDCIPLIGFGGTHYARRQTEIALNSRGAFGHIAPSREIPSIDLPMVEQMSEKSGAVAAFIDRKALSSEEIRSIEDLIHSSGLVRLTEGDLMNFGSQSWKQFLAVRDLAAGVGPDCRPNLHRPGNGSPALLEFSPVLLEETLKADQKGFFEGISDIPLIHLSTPQQSILPQFIITEENREEILNALISLCVTLIRKEQEISIAGDHLIIRKIRFDPRKARELGVPKGPLYGELVKGRTIKVDDRVITPDMVRVSSEKTIHIPGLERYT